ncbi:MAG TPA: hypothetical protein VM490_19480 [Armatimonadaceae bacterium]|nr:hypothetical protein [Armatimonadaceae bacterium]
MKRIPNKQWTGTCVGVAAALSVFAVPAFARQQQGPPGAPPPLPPGGSGGPGRFGGGPGGPGRMGQPARMPELNAATVPVRALERSMGLSDDQKTRLRALAFTLMEDKREAQPLPPDRAAMQQYQEQMRAAGEKMRALDAKAAKDIEALLTAEQKRKLPDVIAEAGLLRGVGLPVEATGDLGLTAEQKEKLKAIADESMSRPGGPGGPGGFGPGGGGPPQGGGPGQPPPPAPGGPGGPGAGAFGGQFRRAPDEQRTERVMDVLTEEQRVKARDYLRRYRRPVMGGGMPGMMGPGMMGPGGGRPGLGPGPGGGPGGGPPPPRPGGV